MNEKSIEIHIVVMSHIQYCTAKLMLIQENSTLMTDDLDSQEIITAGA